MKITVVADHGTHLLISHGDRFAVTERRNDCYYNCHDDSRDGATDISAIGQILDSGDWTDEATARQTFNAVVDRGTELAQRMR